MPAEDPNQIAREKSLSKVRSVYSDLAALPIERNCQLRTECCQFHLTGKTPFLTRGEALLAAKALRATGAPLYLRAKKKLAPCLIRAHLAAGSMRIVLLDAARIFAAQPVAPWHGRTSSISYTGW